MRPPASLALVLLLACRTPAPAPPSREPPKPGAAYVARTAPIYLGRAGGPVVGKLLPGLRIQVLASTGAWAQVRLDPPVGLALPDDFRPWVEAAFLSEAPVPVDWEARAAPLERSVYAGMALSATPGAPPFLGEGCRVVSVGATKGGAVEVTQRAEGIVVSGWAQGPLRRGDCPPRVALGGSVEGLVRTRAKEAIDALGRLASQKARFFWIQPADDGRLRCAEWSPSVSDGTLSGDEPTEKVSYGFLWDGADVALTGPSVLQADGTSTTSPCMSRYRLAGVRADGIALIDLSTLDVEDDAAILAYHPEDAEVWFFERAACEAAAAAANESEGLAITVPVHSGC